MDLWATGATDPGTAPQIATQVSTQTVLSMAPLTMAQLAPVAQEAVAHWAATGLSPSQIDRLLGVQYQITDLSRQGMLGSTGLGATVVQIDATADGIGWFVDRTPASDEEFAAGAGLDLASVPGSPAAGHYDLLTVVEHELGHVLGLDDLNPLVVTHDLMTQTLEPGIRRLPVGVAPTGLGSSEAGTGQFGAPATPDPSSSRPTSEDSFFSPHATAIEAPTVAPNATANQPLRESVGQAM
jgi:hypothetical protein